jgi:uncharacterized protein YbjQ (UPF0145 family)
MGKLAGECLALGGDGVVAVRVEIGPFHGKERTLAFQVYGTAVRARGGVRPPEPFVCHLSAQEFTKLIDACWIPVDLVLGMALDVSHARRVGRFAPNQEMRGWTECVESTRKRARTMLENEAADAGADGVVISEFGLKSYKLDRDRVVEAMFIGTAITAFGSARLRPPREWTLLETLLPALRIPDPEPEPPPSVRVNSIMRCRWTNSTGHRAARGFCSEPPPVTVPEQAGSSPPGDQLPGQRSETSH